MCFNSGNNCSCLWWIIIICLLFCCCGNGSWGSSCGCGGSDCSSTCC